LSTINIPYKETRLIVSLYDYSKKWVQPYIKSGYPVICWDKKIEGCILEKFTTLQTNIETAIKTGHSPYGFLFAPPCTHFAGSGAQWWAKKDAAPPFENDIWNDVDYHVAYVLICLHLVEIYKPAFWVLENPVGRIEKLVPELSPYRTMTFNPCDFGDPYTKKTILYGSFNKDLVKNPVQPEYITWAGKRFPAIWKGTGGSSEKTKTRRSQTPAGFARAFFKANP